MKRGAYEVGEGSGVGWKKFADCPQFGCMACWKSEGWCRGGSADSEAEDICGIAWWTTRGAADVGETLWSPFIRTFGLTEMVPAVAVDAISLAKDAEVVVTGGGRR